MLINQPQRLFSILGYLDLNTRVSIDWVVGLERVRNNKVLYTRLLHKFYCEHQQCEEHVSLALDKGDINQAKRLLHKLKGIAGNLGARDLFGATKNLEDQLHNQSNHLTAHLQFCEAFRIVMHGLQRLTPSWRKNINGDTAPKQTQSIPLTVFLSDVSQLLENNDFKAHRLLPEIHTTLGKMWPDLTRSLAKKIERLRFVEAREIVGQISASLLRLNGEEHT